MTDSLQGLIHKQSSKVPKNYKLYYNDIIRLNKYLPYNIFDNNNCCIWNGYISEYKNKPQINFQLNNNRKPVQRLLYINYINPDIKTKDIIYASCINKYTCCSLRHLIKNETITN